MGIEGKYIYCIINASQDRNFGPIGIGGRGDEVCTIGYNDLSMVVSGHPVVKFVVNRENMLAHQKVIEKVMSEFDSVLPVRFGTVAATCDEVRNLLDKRYREFKNALINMEHKIELNVKGIWKNMNDIFKEITEENKEIKKARDKISNLKSQTPNLKMEVGRMVQDALARKKEKEADTITDLLRKSACDYRINNVMGDWMFMNAAFLVDKGREKEFDNIMHDLGEEYQNRIKFMYTGPFPVFNFVNIIIYPEEWER